MFRCDSGNKKSKVTGHGHTSRSCRIPCFNGTRTMALLGRKVTKFAVRQVLPAEQWYLSRTWRVKHTTSTGWMRIGKECRPIVLRKEWWLTVELSTIGSSFRRMLRGKSEVHLHPCEPGLRFDIFFCFVCAVTWKATGSRKTRPGRKRRKQTQWMHKYSTKLWRCTDRKNMKKWSTRTVCNLQVSSTPTV